jgi:hypothetical protein
VATGITPVIVRKFAYCNIVGVSVMSALGERDVVPRHSAAWLLMAFASASTAGAETAAPEWQIPDLCQTAKSNAECSRLESQSRNSVLDRWSTVPETDRIYCTAKLNKPAARSYWQLLDCLGDRAVQRADR